MKTFACDAKRKIVIFLMSDNDNKIQCMQEGNSLRAQSVPLGP